MSSTISKLPTQDAAKPAERARRAEPKIAILGAGMSGLCMAIQLKKAQFSHFAIYEKADNVGGTWRDNVYPGVACDVPSHLYSFSFARNPDWSEAFSGGAEIQAYCERVTEQYGLAPHLQYGKEAKEATYDNGQWHIRFADGSQEVADAVVSALGGLHHPSIPEFEGRDSFKGASFHSAQWRKDVPLEGKRIAIVGSAASAVQIVPEIAPLAKSLTIYQRTPNWIFPRENFHYSRVSRWLFRRFPFLTLVKRFLLYLRAEVLIFPAFKENSRAQERFRKLAMEHMEELVPDEALRRKLTPAYPVGCKRILFIDRYYEALQLPQVTLETDPIARITPQGIQTQNGQEQEADVIIYATGFKPFEFLDAFVVRGAGGKSLAQQWKDRVETHRTVAVAGFPNFFMLLGPNSGLGHNSVIIMIEAQVRYIVGCLKAIRAQGLRWLAPKREEEKAFNRNLREGFRGSVWAGSCMSWYKKADGENSTLWPWSTIRYRREMAAPKLSEYESDRNEDLRDAAE